MDTQYTRKQLSSIREQAMMYQCACPAQVSELLAQMQDLYTYQSNCLNETEVDVSVHQNIAAATMAAYPVIEKCLTDILVMEGWDLNTLIIPEFLQKRLLAAIEQSRE